MHSVTPSGGSDPGILHTPDNTMRSQGLVSLRDLPHTTAAAYKGYWLAQMPIPSCWNRDLRQEKVRTCKAKQSKKASKNDHEKQPQRQEFRQQNERQPEQEPVQELVQKTQQDGELGQVQKNSLDLKSGMQDLKHLSSDAAGIEAKTNSHCAESAARKRGDPGLQNNSCKHEEAQTRGKVVKEVIGDYMSAHTQVAWMNKILKLIDNLKESGLFASDEREGAVEDFLQTVGAEKSQGISSGKFCRKHRTCRENSKSGQAITGHRVSGFARRNKPLFKKPQH